MATFDEAKLVDDEIEIVIQINGKVKAKLMVPTDTQKSNLEEIAMGDEKVKEQIEVKRFGKLLLYQAN